MKAQRQNIPHSSSSLIASFLPTIPLVSPDRERPQLDGVVSIAAALFCSLHHCLLFLQQQWSTMVYIFARTGPLQGDCGFREHLVCLRHKHWHWFQELHLTVECARCITLLALCCCSSGVVIDLMFCVVILLHNQPALWQLRANWPPPFYCHTTHNSLCPAQPLPLVIRSSFAK